MIRAAPVDLFRRHVRWRSAAACRRLEGARRQHRPSGRHVRAQAGQAEIDHFDVAVAPEHHVVRLEIAMHDALLVRRMESQRDLDGDVERFTDRQRTAADVLAQRRAVDKFHRDERRAVTLADVVDGQNMRVIERRGGSRFVREAAQTIGILINVTQHLDGDDAFETVVHRAIDDTHAAFADKRQDLVRAEPRTRGERHERMAHSAPEIEQPVTNWPVHDLADAIIAW